MFIHWGLYAIPAGEWNGNKNHGEWIRDTARIPVATYEKLRPQWNPVAFDADAWAKMAADAGMKYLVITSKHHDGFCLFDSAETDWDTMNTPFGRDILAELSAACARHGVRFCTYHSIMDWHHPDYLPRRGWEANDRPADGADFGRFERYLHAQVREVIEKYGPAVMWFDGEWENTWSHERGLRLFALCRRLAPAMIVNNRVDVHRGGMGGFSASDEAVGDFATPEQEIPATGVPGVDWESCMTMNAHWGWNRADTSWKSTGELVRNLIDVASKGGNYLLNIGPRADGTFPPQAVERLGAIGAWMRRNGESIHGTTASVFASLAFGRCTVRATDDGTRLYLHVFDWPATGELVLPGLANPVRRAFLLAAPERALATRSGDGGVTVRVPDAAVDEVATVVVVDLDGAPIVYRAPTIAAESTEFVTAVLATIATGTPGLEVRYTQDGSVPTLDSPLAEGPVRIAASCVLAARAFHRGKPVSETVEQRFTRVDPAPAVEPVAPNQGLRVEWFPRIDWDEIPAARATLRPERTGVAATVTTGPAPGEHVAMRFTGFLDVPQDELYRFALASDDGSRLWIDGQLVVDNDGLHATVERRGARALAKGLHPIEVVWFNKTGGAELRLRWALPGQEFREVPESALRH
jgi:alpha-L-fucosidase